MALKLTLRDTVYGFARLSAEKVAFLKCNPFGFFLSSMMAGIYVGMGIILIFSLGEIVTPSLRPLIMGGSFGIALTLVVFAGSELFTGHTMYMTLGRLVRQVRGIDVLRILAVTWFGNLVGSILLGFLLVQAGGGGVLINGDQSFIHTVAQKKVSAPGMELFIRAILCNWLVCLAIWSSSRMDSDIAKCVVIFWCLFAFIASGFEHSVANMTLFSIVLIDDHSLAITVGSALRNLVWVTLGNITSGAVLMATAYWIAAGRPHYDKG